MVNSLKEEESNYLFNSVSLVGRAGSDAEMRYFDSGNAKAEVSIAVDRGKDREGNKITDWFRITFWGRQAEIAGEYVKKGKLVGIEGSVQQDEWVDKQSGEQRTAYHIKANTMRLLGGRND